MNTTQMDTLLIERFLALQSPLERWRLNGYVGLKRLVWRCLTGGTRRIKRGFDAVASCLLLLMASPLLLLVALLIELEDGGPVLFVQTRVGKWGRHFNMFKFRSMYVDAEQRLQELLAQNHHREGVTFKMKNDPRITRVGRWLRRLSLDELPQLFNVLKGDMSLVGPRPEQLELVERYEPEHRFRLDVKPGITGPMQVCGRGELTFAERLAVEHDYIEHMSLTRDLRILLLTIPVGLR